MMWHLKKNIWRLWTRLALVLLGAGILFGATAVLLLEATLDDQPSSLPVSSFVGHSPESQAADSSSTRPSVLQPQEQRESIHVQEPAESPLNPSKPKLSPKMTRKVFATDRPEDMDPDKSLYAAVIISRAAEPQGQDLLFPELSLDSLMGIDVSRIGQLNLFYFDDEGRSNVSTELKLDSAENDGEDSSSSTGSDVGGFQGRMRGSMTLADLHMAFQPITSADERPSLAVCFSSFYPHHDLIPWDDDIDVIIPARQRPLVKEVLRSVPGFALWAPTGVQWKFYWRGSPALQHKPFRWPYVDIFFYTTNGTHLRDDHPDYQAHFRFPHTDVFPLQFRPFAGALLPVPCNMPAVLRVNYFPWLCERSRYLHKLESDAPRHLQARVACRELFPLYAFVHREKRLVVSGGDTRKRE
ncbi:hypothetical protein BaRGS_00008989 [Batillaria attramentaria]|uniref:Uncharacterized protein n=1 Tax=Batillaria attramentaria TaxID=370345 RepID=A0ABD0LKF3_9CAEN